MHVDNDREHSRCPVNVNKDSSFQIIQIEIFINSAKLIIWGEINSSVLRLYV